MWQAAGCTLVHLPAYVYACLFFALSVSLLCRLQVPLMAALHTAQAAMDAHRGVAAVAQQGLGFLWSLSVADANKVSWRAR